MYIYNVMRNATVEIWVFQVEIKIRLDNYLSLDI